MYEYEKPKYAKRNRLFKLFLEMEISPSQILQMVSPMEGKTDEEKEKIAEKLINELLSERKPPPPITDSNES